MVVWSTAVAVLATASSGFSGAVDVEPRVFFSDPASSTQRRDTVSFAFAPRYEASWNADRQIITVHAFGRVDSADGRRTHADVRELNWVGRFDVVELELGVSKVYWGVTESQHLVDVINQTDLIESFDGEQKLGQPLLRVSLYDLLGDFHFFYLPYFRPRTFPGAGGRLRTRLPVDVEHPVLRPPLEAWTPGAAVRWELSRWRIDLGVSYFYGLSRDPILVATDEDALLARYELIHQVGLDVQLTFGGMLLKHESIARTYVSDRAPQGDFIAQTSGFEYTFSSVIGSADVGVLVEYLWASDDNFLSPFDRDLFVGIRLVMNDTQDTQILAGAFVDLEDPTQLVSVEASRRLADGLVASLEMRLFNVARSSFLNAFRRDSYVQLQLRYAF